MNSSLTNPKINNYSEELEFICRSTDEIVHSLLYGIILSRYMTILTNINNNTSLTRETKEAINKYLYNLLSCFDGFISSNEFENLMDILKDLKRGY